MSSVDTETLAEGFAADGREELIERFRQAYAQALGTHSDLVSFDSERIESMVQRSAAEADGLQWRRALAGVAARELGIDLGSALTHPAVVRAHQLAGAPSYESALAALAVPAPVPDPPSAPPSPTPPAVPDTTTASAAQTLGAEDSEPVAPEQAEPEAVEAVELTEAEPASVLSLPEPELAVTESEPEPAVPEPELAVTEPEPEAGLPEPEPQVAELELAVAEPEPEPAELEPELPDVAPEPESEPAPEPESEPTPELSVPEPEPAATADVAEPAAQVAGVDEPTMAYDTLGPEPGSTMEDFEAEPSGNLLAHRADDFAEEFMTGDPVTAVGRAAGADDFTFEADAVGGAAREADVTEFGAVHLGGVASLPSSEEIALRLSEEGLDLLQDDGTIVGRLSWTDIAALEVTVPHGRRRRRNAPRLVVHTAGGSARFEVPSLSGEELQDRVQPLMARFGH